MTTSQQVSRPDGFYAFRHGNSCEFKITIGKEEVKIHQFTNSG